MATFLFCWELGGGLGHNVPLAQIAGPLLADGHGVHVALRDLSTAGAAFGSIEAHPGLRLWQPPVWSAVLPGLPESSFREWDQVDPGRVAEAEARAMEAINAVCLRLAPPGRGVAPTGGGRRAVFADLAGSRPLPAGSRRRRTDTFSWTAGGHRLDPSRK